MRTRIAQLEREAGEEAPGASSPVVSSAYFLATVFPRRCVPRVSAPSEAATRFEAPESGCSDSNGRWRRNDIHPLDARRFAVTHASAGEWRCTDAQASVTICRR